MKKLVAVFTIALAILLLSPVHAAAKEFVPSTLRTDKFSLAEQISFPWDYNEGRDFYQAVACTARVTRRGRIQYPFCLGGDEESRQFEQRVLLTTERARMQPATVVPKHFLNQDEFGMSYSAPQLRYIPGMVNGVPTKMDHLYLVGWRGGWSTYGGSTR